ALPGLVPLRQHPRPARHQAAAPRRAVTHRTLRAGQGHHARAHGARAASAAGQGLTSGRQADEPSTRTPPDDAERRRQLTFDWADIPLVTPELPGTGGAIRGSPEDFQVEELPAYEPV